MHVCLSISLCDYCSESLLENTAKVFFFIISDLWRKGSGWTEREKKDEKPDLRFCFGKTQSWHSSPFTSVSSPSPPLRRQTSVCILRCCLDTAGLGAHQIIFYSFYLLTPTPTIRRDLNLICAFTPARSLLTPEAAHEHRWNLGPTSSCRCDAGATTPAAGFGDGCVWASVFIIHRET